MKWNTYYYVRLISQIMLGGILILGLVGCDPTQEVIVVPEDTNPGLDTTFDVKREAVTAWATLTDLGVMDELTSTSWQNLLDGGQVSVDEDGEAQLRSATCNSIYLFDNGGLKLSSCSEEDLGTDTSCAVSGTSYFDDCGLQVQTASADLSWPGTTLSVSYLERNSDVIDLALYLTLVIALDGEVKVDPVTDIASRALGETIIVPPGNFTYTTPDDVRERVEQITGVIQREPLPLSELPPLAATLGLEPAVEKVQDRADQDGFPFPPSAPRVLVNGSGPGLSDPTVQEAILGVVNWGTILDSIFPEGDTAIIWTLSEEEIDVSTLFFDPAIARERAEALVAEGSVPLIRIVITAGEDEILGRVAALIQKDLADVGLEVVIEGLSSQEEVDAMIEQGEEVIWLTR